MGECNHNAHSCRLGRDARGGDRACRGGAVHDAGAHAAGQSGGVPCVQHGGCHDKASSGPRGPRHRGLLRPERLHDAAPRDGAAASEGPCAQAGDWVGDYQRAHPLHRRVIGALLPCLWGFLCVCPLIVSRGTEFADCELPLQLKADIRQWNKAVAGIAEVDGKLGADSLRATRKSHGEAASGNVPVFTMANKRQMKRPWGEKNTTKHQMQPRVVTRIKRARRQLKEFSISWLCVCHRDNLVSPVGQYHKTDTKKRNLKGKKTRDYGMV